MWFKRFRTPLIALVILITSCNTLGGPPAAEPDLIATITAQALQRQNVVSGSSGTLVPAEAGAASSPELRVSAITDCRAGPGLGYDNVFSMNPGPAAPIIGRDATGSYWIIGNPTGGSCWLPGRNAIVTGDVRSVPQYAAPPLPTAKPTKQPEPTLPAPTTSLAPGSSTATATSIPTAPAAPGGLNGSRNCAGEAGGSTPIWVENVALSWQDNALNETAFRIYKNDILISTIPQNSAQFHIQLRYDQGTGSPLSDTFAVEAFNSVGASTKVSIDVPRCP